MGAGSIVAALTLAGCGFAPTLATDGHVSDGEPADAAPGAWLAGYGYRKAITVTSGTTTNLADFPLGIVESNDAQLATHATGADIVVTASDAVTLLDRQLVSFESNGALELWVRVPSLGPGPLTLYLYYGGPAVADAPIWNAYAGVWHLSEPMAMPVAADSTGHGNALASPSMMQRPASMAGIAGNARVFDGVDDELGGVDPGDGSLDMGLGSFSFSVWVKLPPPTNYATPLWKGGTSGGEHGYCFLMTTTEWVAKVHDGISYRDPRLTGTAINNVWTHLAGVLDRGAGTFTAYLNGAFADVQSIAGIGTLDTALPFDLGRDMITPFKGLVDEARVIKTVLSADWIAAEHANLSDGGFVALDPEQMH